MIKEAEQACIHFQNRQEYYQIFDGFLEKIGPFEAFSAVFYNFFMFFRPFCSKEPYAQICP